MRWSGRAASLCLVLAVTSGCAARTGTTAVTAGPTQALPPDALIIATVAQLVSEEKTDALCVLISDGTTSANIPTGVYASLKLRFPRFFECEHPSNHFLIGPLTLEGAGRGTLDVTRVGAHSACRYRVANKGDSWRLAKDPCVTL